ncbi:MAG: hypothetical protein AVDCRST_MAG71-2171, partial [uncultured Lysobacter sp.]
MTTPTPLPAAARAALDTGLDAL